MVSDIPSSAVALFVRQPIPGCVKTRLARFLGDEAACSLYCAMVADAVAQITASGLPLFLFYDGGEAADLPAEWRAASVRAVRQDGDSLGERMAAAFEALFSSGVEQVMVAGSDIPGISAPVLNQAGASLASHDLAIVPAVDGGYCLLAARRDRYNPAIFRGIPWSTPAVLSATLEVCAAHGVSVTLLDPLQDLDTRSDLEAYCAHPSLHAVSTNTWLTTAGLPEWLLQAEGESPSPL